MRISNVLAGFTLGEADMLRKAMGKKNPEVMAKMRGKFVDGREARRASTRRRPAHIFDLMEHFAGYGFNKSHSTAYAFLAYQTAYLKANYPWHFAAALLTIEAQNTDKLALYLGECRERGIPVLPPDINESQLRFTVEPGKGVRFGLTAIKNVGEGAIESLLDGARRSRGASRRCTRCARISTCGSSTSACSRAWSRPARSIRWRSAIRPSPALPSRGAAAAAHGRHRCRLRARRAAAARQERRAGAAVRRFGASDRAGRTARQAVPLPEAPPWTETEQLAFEKETLGLYWSGHPDRSLRGGAEGVRRADDRRARRSCRSTPRRRRVGTGRSQADRARHVASAASSPRAGS